MTSTITSFAFSVIGLFCIFAAFRSGTVQDFEKAMLIFGGFSAVIVSRLARIEASIDNIKKVQRHG